MKNKSILFNANNTLSIDSKIANTFAILIGSLLIGILAQISIPIPFSPVPITGQTIGVVLVGGVLGSKRGAISIICYLLEGSFGLPVFANMKAGAHVLIGPTGGYLWGFIVAAFLIGYLKEKGFVNSPLNCFISCFISTTTILLIGAFYLSILTGDFSKGMNLGLYPFLVGDIIKSFICAILLLGTNKISS